jgi:ADP-ribosyl-[dinitrogen reductase] hydrolase
MSILFGQSVLDRSKAAYLGLAIGDALGATVEFMTPNEIREAHTVHKDIIGGGWLKLKSGSVTDDTEMSLALGNALIYSGQINAGVIADYFSEWMRSKPVDIGNTVRRGIVNYRNKGATTVPKDEYNAGNGACMRCLPIALATLGGDSETVVTASRIQAHITHHSNLSDAGTEHVINLLQMALQGCSMSELNECSSKFVERNPVFQYDRKKIANPGGYIVETLQAVLHSLYSTDSFESCLVDVVNRGGDADTTGAIAGMISGAYYGMGEIPKRWLKQLDRNIASSCREQAVQLLALAPMSI